MADDAKNFEMLVQIHRVLVHMDGSLKTIAKALNALVEEQRSASEQQEPPAHRP